VRETPIVMVVTDQPDTAERAKESLAQGQMGTATTTLDLLSTSVGRIASPLIVVLDLSMDTSIERFQALEHVRLALPTTGASILAILPLEARAEAARLLAAGVDDFVFEPIDPDELKVRLDALAARRLGDQQVEEGPLLGIRLSEPMRVDVGERIAIDAHYPRRRAKALFVYLYLNRGRQISKYQLLAELWPEAEHADPGRVKHTVQVLRATLEGHPPGDGWRFIHEHGGAYSFNVDAPRWSDVEQFDEELAQARQARHLEDNAAALQHYRRAINLRPGEFLGEFRYDDWAAPDIARLQETFLAALESAARLEADQGNYEPAIDLLRRAVAEDPLHESSYVELMRSLWLDGRRTDAVRTYHRLRDLLTRKLGVEPQAQTTRLYEQIRRDEAIAV
jgi:DNA-binding SARP family transcriptional activator